MKRITVVGGPIIQKIDPVLTLVPTGKGILAEKIAHELEKTFFVERIGSFPGKKECDFEKLKSDLAKLDKPDAIIFLAHVPNVLIQYSENKLRAAPGEEGKLSFRCAEKLVCEIKNRYPKTLLVPFKLAEQGMSKIEIIRWMLALHAGLAVYSRLGEAGKYFIIDVFGNEEEVTKENLPEALKNKILHYLSATRRKSILMGAHYFSMPHLSSFQNFIQNTEEAFRQAREKNVETGRWPGNLSSRIGKEDFLITKRNVEKAHLKKEDFVWAGLELKDEQLKFYARRDGDKPSVDAPVHRIIYKELPWVRHIVHGHLDLAPAAFVHPDSLPFWPCGAEEEGYEIARAAPKNGAPSIWAANIKGHGFVALLGDADPATALKLLLTVLK